MELSREICERVTSSGRGQFICSNCLSITVISRIAGGFVVVEIYAHFLRFVVTWLLGMTVVQVQIQTNCSRHLDNTSVSDIGRKYL